MFKILSRLLPTFLLFAGLLSYAQESQDCLRAVGGNAEAYTIRRDLIQAARNELVFSYYSFMPEKYPLYLLVLIKEAAERGVKVRMILDDSKSKIPDEILELLGSNVEVKIYNPMNLGNLARIDRRLHDKFIVVDGQLVLVGGRNIRDDYFNPDLTERGTFYDLDVLISGGPAQEALGYFNERWESSWVDPLKLPESKKIKREGWAEKMALALADLHAQGELNSELSVAGFALTTCSEAQFFATHPTQRRRDLTLEDELIEEMDRAERFIDIQNPYFVPTKKLKKAFKRALKRGVEIRLITNSMQSADVALTQAAYLNTRRKYLRWGVSIYEFQHKQTLHTKMMIFDKQRALVGSYNLDPRSARINSETFVIVEDERAIGPINVFFEETIALSSKLDKKGRPEGYDQRHPGTSFGKRLMNVLLRFTIAPILRGKL